MKRNFALPVFAAAALMASVLISTPSTFAHATAASTASRIAVNGKVNGEVVYCQHWRVQLHGESAATGTCLDNQGSKAGATPDLSNRYPCNTDDVHLWQDTGGEGASICFYNTGSVNLADWRINIFVTWDNQASSWYSGRWSGVFYPGSNDQGVGQTFSANQGISNFNCHTVCNDDLSSMKITG